MMPPMLASRVVATVAFICYSAHAYSGSFADADVSSKGTFSLSHSQGDTKAMASISVRAPKRKEPARPIGNVNSLVKMNIALDGVGLSIPKECKRMLLDVNYIRLENVGALFRFWVQGGDGSEAYQVAFTFARTQPVKCRFLPDANDVAIEPMLSKKTLNALSKNIKK
jgi:hypothetical protein